MLKENLTIKKKEFCIVDEEAMRSQECQETFFIPRNCIFFLSKFSYKVHTSTLLSSSFFPLFCWFIATKLNASTCRNAKAWWSYRSPMQQKRWCYRSDGMQYTARHLEWNMKGYKFACDVETNWMWNGAGPPAGSLTGVSLKFLNNFLRLQVPNINHVVFRAGNDPLQNEKHVKVKE